VQRKNLLNGVWLFIVSEAVLFFGLLWSCVHLGMSPSVWLQMQVRAAYLPFLPPKAPPQAPPKAKEPFLGCGERLASLPLPPAAAVHVHSLPAHGCCGGMCLRAPLRLARHCSHCNPLQPQPLAPPTPPPTPQWLLTWVSDTRPDSHQRHYLPTHCSGRPRQMALGRWWGLK